MRSIRLDPSEERSVLLEEFVDRAQAYLDERGWQDRCNVNVRRETGFFVLEGTVTHDGIKSKLLALLHEARDAGRLEDRVRVMSKR